MFWGGGTVSSPPSQHSEVSNSSSSSVTSGCYSPDSTFLYTNIVGENRSSFSENNGPHLKILEDVARQFRFRYMTEMQGTHGAIQGITSSKKKKTFPNVQLCGFDGTAVIRCTLYTSDKKSLHVHKLVGKSSGKEKGDPHDITVGPNVKNRYIACFQNLVIIHTARKEFVNELIEKKKRVIKANFQNERDLNIPPQLLTKMKIEAEEEKKKMDLNCTRLKFEALTIHEGQYRQIPGCEPVFSSTIKNMKNHVTGQLKICRVGKVSGSCEGGEEIYLLVEKVGKGNIKVVMTECNEFGEEVWSDECSFSPTDVHHQYAIVCRTPKYRNTDIKENVSVKLQLERRTDSARSEPIEFVYKPKEGCYVKRNNNKRMRLMPSERKFPLAQHLDVTSTTVNREQPVRFDLRGSLESDDDPMWLPDSVTIPANYIQQTDINSVITLGNNESQFISAFDELPTPDLEKFDVFNSDEIASHIKEGSLFQHSQGLYRFDQLEHDGIVAPDSKLTSIFDYEGKVSEIPDSGIPHQQMAYNIVMPDPSEFHEQANYGVVIPDPSEFHEQANYGVVTLDPFKVYAQGGFVAAKDLKFEGVRRPVSRFRSQMNANSREVSDCQFGLIVARHLIRLHDSLCLPKNKVEHLLSNFNKIMEIRSSSGDNVLHTIMKYKQLNCLILVLKFIVKFQRGDLMNSRNDRKETPLHIAGYSNNKVTVQIMQKLLDAGSDPNLLDVDGRTALHIAVRSRCVDTATCLLGSPLTDVDCVSDSDGTALHIAAEMGDVELTRLLLEHDADINSINKKTGRTPLHVAAVYKNYDIVAILLQQKNLEVNKKDFNGFNPLKLAFVDENIPWKKMCQQLVNHGATFYDSEEKPLKPKTEDDGTDDLFEKFVELWIQDPQN